MASKVANSRKRQLKCPVGEQGPIGTVGVQGPVEAVAEAQTEVAASSRSPVRPARQAAAPTRGSKTGGALERRTAPTEARSSQAPAQPTYAELLVEVEILKQTVQLLLQQRPTTAELQQEINRLKKTVEIVYSLQENSLVMFLDVLQYQMQRKYVKKNSEDTCDSGAQSAPMHRGSRADKTEECKGGGT